MLAVFFTIAFVLGIVLLVREILRSSIFRAEQDARARLRNMFAQSNPDATAEVRETQAAKKEKGSSPLLDRVTGWLQNSNLFKNQEGRQFLDVVEHQLVLSGLSRTYTPHQALALALTIWSIGVIVPSMFFATGNFPLPLYIVCVVAALIFPPMKLKQEKKKRQEAIKTEVPWMIHELSMALATGALTLDDALARVTRAAEENVTRTPLAQEFAQAYIESRLGARDREEALRDIATRTEVLEVETFVETLITAQRTGSEVVTVLDQYAAAAADGWKQDTIAFINKTEPQFMIGLVMMIFGIMALFTGPIIISALSSFGG